jgi:acetyl esterase
VQLWNDQLEELRPQLRAEAAAMIAEWGDAPEDATDAERVIYSRTAENFAAPALDPLAETRRVTGPRGGDVGVRIIRPAGQARGVLLHIHGGGWVSGNAQTYDPLHRIFADQLQIATVSVDYRLAPEFAYPAAPDDCEDVAIWLLEHAAAEFGSDRLLIGGESAGGQLAACTLLRVRDRHDAIDRFFGANLVFGLYDFSGLPSHRGVGTGPGLDTLGRGQMEFFHRMFTGARTTEELRDPDLSPLYADLHDLPPALFTVGARDHLLDDTLLMAQRWRLAGNDATVLLYPEGPHGCIVMPSIGAHWFPRLMAFFGACLSD